eukprot:scaffold7207_cov520-Prasinococcus_capsulatus_cf.AAC.6
MSLSGPPGPKSPPIWALNPCFGPSRGHFSNVLAVFAVRKCKRVLAAKQLVGRQVPATPGQGSTGPALGACSMYCARAGAVARPRFRNPLTRELRPPPPPPAARCAPGRRHPE